MKILQHTIEEVTTFDEKGVTHELFKYATGEKWLIATAKDLLDEEAETITHFIGDDDQIDDIHEALNSDVAKVDIKETFIFKESGASIAKFTGKKIGMCKISEMFRVVVEIRDSTYLVADQCEHGAFHFDVTECLEDAIAD
jgi:hypothetical protein